MLAAIRELYFAMWANLSLFSMTQRAAIVVFIVLFVVWLVARPVLRKLASLLLRLLNLGVKGIFLLGKGLLFPFARISPERYARWYNSLADRMEQCSKRLTERSTRQVKGKIHFGRMILVYAVIMLFIGLPSLLGSTVSEQYLPYFSYASNLYHRLESPALEAAAAYQPLIISPDTEVEARNGTGAVAMPTLVEDESQEVWLSLSKKGRGGSNMREGPGTDYKVLATISGDEQVLYLDDRSGGWIHVQRLDGTEGWIYENLLSGLP